jgi:GNAT superfamily N-acetyltransferase
MSKLLPPLPEHAPATILRLDAATAKARMAELTGILLDCVDGGASVSFMAGMTSAQANAFWRRVIKGVDSGGRILLAAEIDGKLVGTVQAVASGIPNQPHRSDLSKMLVHRAARGRGVGAAMLAAAEAASLEAGWWLMVLDTVVESSGDRLYAKGGWKPVGVVPDFALWPDGRLCATRYFFKDLRRVRPIRVAEETPAQSDVIAFLEAGNTEMAALYPAESNHMVDVASLQRPEVSFFVARRHQDGFRDDAAGCGALLAKPDGTGELKRFFTNPHLRGTGVGSAIIKAVEAKARALGLTMLRLETGIHSAGALALYRAAGFTPCTAFAPYQPDPWSVFLEKRLKLQ